MKVWIAVALVLLVGSTAWASQDIKIGYVDLQRALNECEGGRKAKEEFKKQVDKYQGDLKKQKEDLESMKEQLEKKGPVMKEDERRNLQGQFEKKAREFERNYKDSQEELQRKDNELTGEILKGLHRVIQEFGKREGYTLLLESSSTAVLFVTPDADLTDDVVKEYNQRKK